MQPGGMGITGEEREVYEEVGDLLIVDPDLVRAYEVLEASMLQGLEDPTPKLMAEKTGGAFQEEGEPDPTWLPDEGRWSDEDPHQAGIVDSTVETIEALNVRIEGMLPNVVTADDTPITDFCRISRMKREAGAEMTWWEEVISAVACTLSDTAHNAIGIATAAPMSSGSIIGNIEEGRYAVYLGRTLLSVIPDEALHSFLVNMPAGLRRRVRAMKMGG